MPFNEGIGLFFDMADNQIEPNRKNVVIHLQMIQEVIARMAWCSFLLKQWSIIVFAALLTYLASSSQCFFVNVEHNIFVMTVICSPFAGFWLMDAFYLKSERTYRRLFDRVRIEDDTAFQMTADSKDVLYWRTIFSKTIAPFYLMQVVVLAMAILNSKTMGSPLWDTLFLVFTTMTFGDVCRLGIAGLLKANRRQAL